MQHVCSGSYQQKRVSFNEFVQQDIFYNIGCGMTDMCLFMQMYLVSGPLRDVILSALMVMRSHVSVII